MLICRDYCEPCAVHCQPQTCDVRREYRQRSNIAAVGERNGIRRIRTLPTPSRTMFDRELREQADAYANGDMSSSIASRKNLRLSNVISILSCDSQGAWNLQLFLCEWLYETKGREFRAVTGLDVAPQGAQSKAPELDRESTALVSVCTRRERLNRAAVQIDNLHLMWAEPEPD